jgi:hypothetical protein
MTSATQPARMSGLSLRRTEFTWRQWGDWWWLGALLLVAIVIRLWLFRGFMGSDDVIYATRGLEVLAGLWSPSDYNGALRYGINLPIAAAVGLLGRSEGALAAWGLICSLGEIAVIYVYALRIWGTRVAVSASLVLATIPQHIDSATNITADAPFAALLTLSMVLLHFGVSSGKAVLLVGAGLAVGFAGWIKPEAAIVFSIPFGILALAFTASRRKVLWLVFGAAAAASLNLMLFTWAFADPFYYAHVLARQIKAGSANPASWQSYDANFYFRLLFLDGRTLWLAPMLAVLGAWFAVYAQGQAQRRTGLFTVLWAIFLLVFFSFFVYSLSPLRLIPKQTNYAIIFAAPIAVLAGVALARMRAEASIALMAVLCIGGVLLAALDGYGHNLHAASHRDTIRFAQANRSSVVYASGQTLNLNHVLGLMGQENAGNLLPLKEMTEVIAVPHSLPEGFPIIAAYHSAWPEWRGEMAGLLQGAGAHCVRQIAQSVGAPSVTDLLVTRIVRAVRASLPSWADRQMRFTDKLLLPEFVQFYSVDRGCLAQIRKTALLSSKASGGLEPK